MLLRRMSDANEPMELRTLTPERTRERAYGQGYRPTFIDRLGVWLSARQILQNMKDSTYTTRAARI
jgi:hypothetical protein